MTAVASGCEPGNGPFLICTVGGDEHLDVGASRIETHFVTSTLHGDEHLDLGAWRIEYREGRIYLTYARARVRVEIAPTTRDTAVCRIEGAGLIPPIRRGGGPVVAGDGAIPLVIEGQGDYARPYAPDLIDEAAHAPTSEDREVPA